jgi:guanylate kinase
VLEIDVQGARQVLAQHPDALLLFIDAPTRDEQRRRLEGRGDPPEKVAQRLAIAEAEAEAAQSLGMRRIVNDDLDRATAEVAAVIDAARRSAR